MAVARQRPNIACGRCRLGDDLSSYYMQFRIFTGGVMTDCIIDYFHAKVSKTIFNFRAAWFLGGILVNEFEKKIEIWLDEKEPNFAIKAWHLFLFVRYNKIFQELRLSSVIRWSVRFALTASGPVIAYYVYQRITIWQAGLACGVLFGLFTLNSAAEQWLKQKSSVEGAASEEAWVRVGDLINSVKSSATPAGERDRSIIATLGVIEGYARIVTKSPKGDIAVNLALYDGNSTTNMKIRHRNSGNERPIGRPLKNLDNVLGHIACNSGPGPRVVQDLKDFGKEALFSPTQSTRNYRSLLLIPITSGRTGKMKGFVSIDCARPYAFYGNRAKKLIVTCEPLIDHIQEQC